MHTIQTDDAHKTPFLLLAVLLHILILLLFFIIPVYQNKQETPEITALSKHIQELLPKKDIARLKPRTSNFGAPIIMLEEPSPAEKETQKSEAETKNISEKSHEQEQRSTAEEPASTIQHDTDKKSAVSSEYKHQTLPSFIPEYAQEKRHLQEALKQESPSTTQDEDNIPIGKHHKSAPEQHTQTQHKKQPAEQAPIKKELTLADLAKGFLHSIKQEGNDWLEREGNENIRPDTEELKFLSYQRKVAWFIQNSLHTERNTFHTDHIQKLVTTIQMTVDKDGNLVSHKMIKSSGNSTFDAIVIRCTKDAAPYPPLPKHFNMEEFPMYWSIYTYAGPQGPSMSFTTGRY